jgi:hypothetical protein
MAGHQELGDVDALLVELIHAANAGAEIGLTVTASGQVVTGTLIAERVYYAGLTKDLEAAGELGATVAAGVGHFADDLFDDLPDSNPRPVSFLHLKDARYLSAGSLYPTNPTARSLWRGRLDHVSGWVLGTLAPSPLA